MYRKSQPSGNAEARYIEWDRCVGGARGADLDALRRVFILSEQADGYHRVAEKAHVHFKSRERGARPLASPGGTLRS
ncbi:hypothetical protein OH77DRAFT_1430937 [Trametes cingulata]|nr:hypothetical protein OH77DRAFT_1430937 [Trametes cingulata]